MKSCYLCERCFFKM